MNHHHEQRPSAWEGIFFPRRYLPYFLVTIALHFAFILCYFNHFLPIQDGWIIEWAYQWNHGKTIYKDFYVFIQPIYVLIFGGIGKFFGYDLLNFRFYGLVERFFLVSLVFIVYSRLTTPFRTAVLTITSLFFFAASTVDVIYSYYQFVAILVLASLLCLLRYFQTRSSLSIFGAGIFAGLAFMSKQSTGLLVPVSILLMFAVLLIRSTREDRSLYIPRWPFFVGMALPVALVLTYLVSQNSLSEYWSQVFAGAASKGKLTHILFNFWGHLLGLKATVASVLFFGAMIVFSKLTPVLKSPIRYELQNPLAKDWPKVFGPAGPLLSRAEAWLGRTWAQWRPVVIARWERLRPYSVELRHIAFFCLLLLLTVLVFGAGVMRYIDRASAWYFKVGFFENRNKLVYLSFLFNAVMVVFYLLKALRGSFLRADLTRATVAVVSFASMYAHGLSGFIEPHAVLLSMGLMFLWILDLETPWKRFKNWSVYGLLFGVALLHAYEKNALMYSWWGWLDTGSWTAKTQPKTPLLSSFRLNKDKAKIIDGIVEAIQYYSKPGEPIFTFPHMPMFYMIADRPRFTFSAVHYFDVCPDGLAESDAKKVAETMPAVILMMRFPKNVWTLHEDIFRGGHLSGQRKIQTLIDRLVSEGKYRNVRLYKTYGYDYAIHVMVRSDLVDARKPLPKLENDEDEADQNREL